MPIELIVETGTMPPGANTYVSLDDYRNYKAQRDPEYDPDAADSEGEKSTLIRATDTLNSYRWKSVAVDPGRIMAWPRKHMEYADGSPVHDNVVPAQVVAAQCEIAGAIEAAEGKDPLAPVDASQGAITSEKVDVIAVSYATPDTNAYTGKTGYPAVDALLRPFLRGGSGAFGIVEMGRG